MKSSQFYLLFLAFACTTHAKASGFFIEGGAHLGGDTLFVGIFDNLETDTVDAGELFSFDLGLYTTVSESLMVKASIGYKFDSITARNGDITFSRVPVTTIASYRVNDYWMLGGGLTYHNSPRLVRDAESIGSVGTSKFDSALGYVLAVDYSSHGAFEGDWYIGGRITVIDYEIQAATFNGNSIGVVFGFMH